MTAKDFDRLAAARKAGSTTAIVSRLIQYLGGVGLALWICWRAESDFFYFAFAALMIYDARRWIK